MMIKGQSTLCYSLIWIAIICFSSDGVQLSYEDELDTLQQQSVKQNQAPEIVKCKVRKEFTFMSIGERMRFVNAYKKLTTTEPFKTRFKTLIMDHPKLASHVHNKEQFLPWHRLFLLKFERLLAEVDRSVTLPYWDWSLNHLSPWGTSTLDIWSPLPWGLGGDGDDVTYCVTNGPFANNKWSIATNDGSKSCLRRKFNGILPGIMTIHRALRFHPDNFTQFEDYIRNFLHDVLHWRVGGTMGDKYGSRAPEFILHHAFLDKIWADYQNQSPQHKWVYFRDTHGNVYDTDIPLRKMVDNEDVLGTKICYKDPFDSYNDTHESLRKFDLNKIRNLMTKDAFTAPYFDTFLKY